MPNNKLGADPKKEFCSNPNCRDYGKRGAGNIVKYGHDKNGRQRFKCKTCDSVFVETKNTVFYNRKLSEDQIILICELLVEKNGIRAIERITEIHRDTITRVIENFDVETINYGQLIKEREKGRVVGKTRTIIFGEVDGIATSYVERYNLTLRHGISRLVRESLCFSKCKEMLDNHLDVYRCYNNLVRINSALTIKTGKGKEDIERTPCMAEGITDHIWTWKELLMCAIDGYHT